LRTQFFKWTVFPGLQVGGGCHFPVVLPYNSSDISRWVYIIEGIFSITIAVAVWFGLPTNPAEAYFLNEEEKEMMRLRYAMTRQYLGSETFSWKEIRIEFQDPKLYVSGCIQFCQVLQSYSSFQEGILVLTMR
jgi:hypothetical protein